MLNFALKSSQIIKFAERFTNKMNDFEIPALEAK